MDLQLDSESDSDSDSDFRRSVHSLVMNVIQYGMQCMV